MADKQTQDTAITPHSTVAPKPIREFINVPTAENSRLNKGLDEDIYGSQHETKDAIRKSW